MPAGSLTTDPPGDGRSGDQSVAGTHDGLVPAIYEELRRDQKERRALERLRIQLGNGILGQVRTVLSWEPEYRIGEDTNLEALRGVIKARAKAIVAAISKGRGSNDPVAPMLLGFLLPVLASVEPIRRREAEIEKRMERQAAKLAVADWVRSVRGFSLMGLATIVGEAGDLSNYANPAKLWKRLGLGRVQHGDGTWHTQGKPSSAKTSAEDWIAHGYDRTRLANIVGRVSIPLFISQSERFEKDEKGRKTAVVTQEAGHYRLIYDRAKERAQARIIATKGLPDKIGDRFNPEKWTPKRADNHGRRLMTKSLIRDLWRVWHGRAPRAVASNDGEP